LEKLRQDYDLIKNQRLSKYEIKQDNTDIDIYLPFFSDLGIPCDEIQKNTIKRAGLIVPKIEILMILNNTLFEIALVLLRGKKDKIDIISMLQQDFNFDFYLKILKKQNKQNFINDLRKIFEITTEIPELNLNQHKFLN